jgi:hypothetical protein
MTVIRRTSRCHHGLRGKDRQPVLQSADTQWPTFIGTCSSGPVPRAMSTTGSSVEATLSLPFQDTRIKAPRYKITVPGCWLTVAELGSSPGQSGCKGHFCTYHATLPSSGFLCVKHPECLGSDSGAVAALGTIWGSLLLWCCLWGPGSSLSSLFGASLCCCWVKGWPPSWPLPRGPGAVQPHELQPGSDRWSASEFVSSIIEGGHKTPGRV